MLLWVGLGNPEAGLARQRHNIGFMALDVIAHRHGFSPWRQRFKGLVAEGQVGGERVMGLKPLTYMNASGESVQAAAAFYKLPADAITSSRVRAMPGIAFQVEPSPSRYDTSAASMMSCSRA